MNREVRNTMGNVILGFLAILVLALVFARAVRDGNTIKSQVSHLQAEVDKLNAEVEKQSARIHRNMQIIIQNQARFLEIERERTGEDVDMKLEEVE